MKNGTFGFRKIIHLVFISMLALQPGFAWADAEDDANTAADLKVFSLSSANEVKQFTAKYCKKGFAIVPLQMGMPGFLVGRIAAPPANYNDDDGAHCYQLKANVLKVIGDSEALYSGSDDSGHWASYYISFGKGGRAVSSIWAIVTVKGGQSFNTADGGKRIVTELKVIKTRDLDAGFRWK